MYNEEKSDNFRAFCVVVSSTNVTIASSSKKKSLMTIQNRVKRSFFTTQMDAVEL